MHARPACWAWVQGASFSLHSARGGGGATGATGKDGRRQVRTERRKPPSESLSACLFLKPVLTRGPLQEAEAQGLATGAVAPAGGRGSEDGEGDLHLADSELHRLRVVHHLRCTLVLS